MKTHAAKALALAATFLCAGASAESFEALERTVEFDVPAGFCKGGESPPEKALYEMTVKAASPDIRLVYWAAECEDLVALRQGTSGGLTRWLQVQLARNGASFRPYEGGRSKLIESFGGGKISLPTVEASRVALNKTIAAFENSAEEVLVEKIGADKFAAYVASKVTVKGPEGVIVMRGVTAMTLVKKLPLVVIVMQRNEYTGKAQLGDVVHELVQSLMDKNGEE